MTTPRQDFYISLGERLRDLRLAHRYTVGELANLLSCSDRVYMSYEQPQTSASIDVWTAMKLAKIYGVSIMSIIPPAYEEKK